MGTTLDDGSIVEQFAKILYWTILSVYRSLNDKASDYGIELTQEEIAQCEKDA